MALSVSQKKQLRRMAHHLKPVVIIGHKGLSSTFLAAVEEGLGRHELLKVRLGGVERAERDRITASVIEATGAERVQRIGFTLTLYRRNAENPKITLGD